jgi:N-acetylglucosamine malate deacetylase 1
MPTAIAIFAHPDDIEFRAAGTLSLLRQRGWQLHYWNLSSGNLGSTVMTAAQTARVRRREARAAAEALGAKWHAPIANDLELFYTDALIRRVCAVVREVRPDIVLTHPPADYMEDHTTACRLAVTGTFARGIPNYRSTPARRSLDHPCTLYHSVPHGLCGPLREPFQPDLVVNIASVLAEKKAALGCHRSQQEWLDATQGPDSFLSAIDTEAVALSRLYGRFKSAEVWRRHLHLGFGAATDDPLATALGTAAAAPRSPAR